jgi:hypothetical protein
MGFSRDYIHWEPSRFLDEDAEDPVDTRLETALEVHFLQSPYTMVNLFMPFSSFSPKSRNYRMEAILLFTLGIISTLLSIGCLCLKRGELTQQ